MGLEAKPLSTPVVLLHLFSLLAAVSAKLKTSDIQFDYFNDTYDLGKALQVDSPAVINNGALQVTLDSVNPAFFINQAGRILYKHPFTLWDGQNGTRVGSFNTSFLVNLYRVGNNTPGEGLAFVVAPDLNLPPNSFGQYLGLTNSTTDGEAANRLVAVELDTFKEYFDPDSNHVGLNINSVRSKITTSLTPLGFQLVGPADTANFFNVWVQYDGILKVINVYIAQQVQRTDPTPPRPANPILTSNLELRGVVNQNSYFGFSASTSNATQLNCVLRWNLSVEHYYDNTLIGVKIGLAIGIPAVVLLTVAAGVGYFLRKRWLSRLKGLPGTPREFQFKDLQKATNKFDEKMKLGQGGFGVVYKGYLANENLEVAVKMFSRESLKGQDDFLADLTIINRLRHRHLVRLLGWCHKHGKLLLVYEYMPNLSLDRHLFSNGNSKPLSWDLRLKIISGVASALHYLHIEYDKRVVHRDLKASNIMLDSEFNARLGDFGLAQALDNEKTSYAEAEGVLGTLGYIAPECFHTGKATQQFDVYAFGAVLLEVVCGEKAGSRIGGYQFLVDWVWAMHREGKLLEAVDKRLGEDYVVQEAQRILLLGLACSHPIASERPRTQEIGQMVSGSVIVPEVPPFKPAFVWPSLPMGEEGISMATTTNTTSYPTSQYGSYWTPLAVGRDTQRPYSDSFNTV